MKEKTTDIERLKKREMLAIILLLIIDQGSKAWMESVLAQGSITVIPNFFELEFVTNTGAAWSIFRGNVIFLIVISLFVMFALVMMYPTVPKSRLKSISYILLYAGIIGNLLDRMIFHYVKDFLKFTIFGYQFPVFNFADMFIVIGAVLLMIVIWKGDKSHGNNQVSKRRKRKI